MNDELTPDERAAMRAPIVGGARDIAPVGAHRNAWIAGSIAAVLVVAIAGGVVATSTLSAPPIANTPTPSPETVESQASIMPDCTIDGFSCQYVDRFGDAAVMVWGSTNAQLAALTDAVGERAARSPGTARSLPAGAWTVPECADIRDAIDAARGRGDIVDHRGDYYPRGFDWEVLRERGAAAYCAVDNLSAPEGTTTVVDMMFGPGSSPDLDAISRHGGLSVEVSGADAAWYLPGFTSTASLLVVQSGPNTLTVGTQSMTEEEMRQVGAAVIAALG
ncbi:hypothetical protein CSIV_04550 [Microbacterium sp. CSI-V]|uniref:hypothetical protein n=1 Tax=unclassified Microbacterium TaxID=2609290 RepID=UPI00097C9A64|nr:MULTISPECIES: hypothetical protein [unclassified Microbacterium]MXS74772.1 hypothetical protein [Microbacterium sp. TL13]ONI65558.1 hypothetical protein CSIV_04550 [Microbacterium sp. CSI-V]